MQGSLFLMVAILIIAYSLPNYFNSFSFLIPMFSIYQQEFFQYSVNQIIVPFF